MFIVSKALLISSAIVIVCTGGGGIWLNPFATVLFTMCSAVSSPVSLRGGILACMRSLFGFEMGTMLANSICVVLCWC